MKTSFLLAAVCATALAACDHKPVAVEGTPTPTPADESTADRLKREASEMASDVAEATRNAADKAKPAFENAGEKIKEVSGQAADSMRDAAASAREKIREATASDNPTPTPTPTPTPPPVIGS